MTEEKNKQIQIINNFIMYCRGFEEKKYTDKELFTAIENVGELIQKQQTENKKKDKIIDVMAEHIVSSAIVDDTVCAIKFCEIEEDCTHEKMLSCTKQYFENKVKQYFERKVENENRNN